ncbi:MAG TPA: STAS domain-containing protein, partial [Candidatus Binatia bacterium]|nr:STAS domain-containing protein [Candidatus Binatia bacterium]
MEEPRAGALRLRFRGRLDAATTGTVWRHADETVRNAKAREVVVDAAGIDYCDGAGIALLVHLRNLQNSAGGALQIEGLRPEFASLLDDAV